MTPNQQPFNRPFVLFLLHSALYHIGYMGIPDVLLNFYFISLGYSPDVIGLMQSLPRLSGLLTGLPVGLFADRIGPRRIILYSTLGLAAAMLLLALYPSLLMLGVTRFLMGMFYGADQIAFPPLMSMLAHGHQQTRLYAWHNIVSMGAAAVGSFVGGFLPGMIAALFPEAVAGAAQPAQSSFAYAVGLAASAAIILVSIVPLLSIRDHELPVPPTPESERSVQWASLPWGKLVWLGLPLLLFGFSGGLTFPFYNLFFRARFAVDDVTVGTILGIGWVGMALVPMLNPFWEQRVGRVRALGFTLSTAAVAFFALSLAPTLMLALPAFAVAISARNTMQPLFNPLIMSVLPEHERAIATSVGFVQWNIGWFLATSVSGTWQANQGFGFIMQVVAGCVLATAFLILLIFRPASEARDVKRA